MAFVKAKGYHHLQFLLRAGNVQFLAEKNHDIYIYIYIYIYVAMVEKNSETILLSLRACTRDKSIGSLFFPLSLYSYVSSTVERKNQYTDFLHICVHIYTFFLTIMHPLKLRLENLS